MKKITKVRLNKKYLLTIKKLALKHFNSDEVRIFGSRADMEKKGGDIDIYIKTNMEKNILIAKIAFLSDFMKEHGEQKVDLIIETNKNKKKKIFKIARNKGVKI